MTAQPEELLAPGARQRVTYLIRRLENAVAPADLRDYGIALAAVSASLEDLERIDGRLWLDRERLERWTVQLRELLERLGTPPDDDEHARRPWTRAYYGVREGLLDDLHDALRPRDSSGYTVGYEAAPLEPDDVGIFGLVEALEKRRDTLEALAERQGQRIAALETERSTLAQDLVKAGTRIAELEGRAER